MAFVQIMRLDGDDEEFEMTIENMSAINAVKWLAEKYGTTQSLITIGTLMKHAAVMGTLTSYAIGNGLDHPESTPGDEYDSISDDLHGYQIYVEL